MLPIAGKFESITTPGQVRVAAVRARRGKRREVAQQCKAPRSAEAGPLAASSRPTGCASPGGYPGLQHGRAQPAPADSVAALAEAREHTFLLKERPVALHRGVSRRTAQADQGRRRSAYPPSPPTSGSTRACCSRPHHRPPGGGTATVYEIEPMAPATSPRPWTSKSVSFGTFTAASSWCGRRDPLGVRIRDRPLPVPGHDPAARRAALQRPRRAVRTGRQAPFGRGVSSDGMSTRRLRFRERNTRRRATAAGARAT